MQLNQELKTSSNNKVTANNQNLFLILLVLFEFSVYVSNDMILPAINAVYKDFNAPEKDIPYALGFFLFGCVLIQLFGGPLSDRFGRRKAMFLGGWVVFLGNLLAILSQNIYIFYFARLFQGMGLCFIGVAGYACVHELFQQKEAVRNIAWMSSIALFAPMVGPLLGSLIFLSGSWRMIFLTTFILNIIACIGLYFFMPESLALNKRSSLNIKYLIQSYLNILSNKFFMLSALFWGFIISALMIWISSSPLILMNHLHLSSFEFGLVQIPVFLAFIFGILFLRFLTKTFSVKECAYIGGLIVSISAIPIFLSAFTKGHFLLISIIASISLFNFGIGVISAPLNRLTIESSTEPKGILTALFSFVTLGISALAPIIFAAIYDGEVIIFTSSIAILLLISAFIQFFIKRSFA